MHKSIDFAALARGLLRSGGYTTKTLGEAIGLSQPAVSRLASGKTGEIGAQAGVRLIELVAGKGWRRIWPELADAEGALAIPPEEIRDAA